MNQEFITILHLVDVRVAFSNGLPEMREEVPLHRLDALLDKYAADDAAKNKMTQMVRDALEHVFDYRDRSISLIEERQLDPGEDGYLRVRKELVSSYEDETGNRIAVPGIILSATKHVLRTDGVIVEALLGQGHALDAYSSDLQEAAVRAKELANDAALAQLAREELGRTVVEEASTDKAEAFAKIFYPPPDNED